MIRTKQCIRAIVTLAAGIAITGCSSQRVSLERDRLMQENHDLRDALSRVQDDQLVTATERDRLVGEVQRLQNDLTAQPVTVAANTGFDAIQGVDVEHGRGMIKVNVPGDVLFAPGQATLRSTAKRTLDQIASVIKTSYGDNTIGIEGHTDRDPIKKSKWADNLELSVQRAAAVHRYLRSRGIDARQMYAAGWGPTRPRSSKSKSRRVEIVIWTG